LVCHRAGHLTGSYKRANKFPVSINEGNSLTSTIYRSYSRRNLIHYILLLLLSSSSSSSALLLRRRQSPPTPIFVSVLAYFCSPPTFPPLSFLKHTPFRPLPRLYPLLILVPPVSFSPTLCIYSVFLF
jgi:hypothetical protein